MDIIDLLRQIGGRTDAFMRACQKINEGIRELSAEMARIEPVQHKHDLSVLTRRQREILDLIAKGMSAEDVSKHLSLSLRTVQSHRDTIRKRLHFKSVSDLEEFAKRKS